MEKQNVNLRFSVLAGMILLAAVSRMVPHMMNFAPMGAMALFGAAHFRSKWLAFLVPVAATWLSDLYLNNVIYNQYYPEFCWFSLGMFWSYGAYLLTTICGVLVFRRITAGRVIGGALAASLLFFFISNFGVWYRGTMYPHTMAGLRDCYITGIPFLKGTLLGNLFYSTVLFGSFALMQRKFSALCTAQA
jgi:hypothetical protein